MSKFWHLLIVFLCVNFYKSALVTEFPYEIEGEDMVDRNGDKAKLWKLLYKEELPGYSGEGFANLDGKEYGFEIEVEKEGLYRLSIIGQQRQADHAARTEFVQINEKELVKNVEFSDEWKEYDFGLVHLNKGKNVIFFTKKYSYILIDKAILSKPDWPDFKKVDSTPCDPKATKETVTLMKYLHKIYGEKILSGQYDIYGGGHNGNYDYEIEYIEKLTGKVPAIRGIDVANHNNVCGWEDNAFNRMIEWGEKGGIITSSYHLKLPKDWNNYELGQQLEWTDVAYTPNKDFKVANSYEKGTKENKWLDENIKIIAEGFLKLQEKGIPVIWRPFHEAEGNGGDNGAFFWWGQEKWEVFKKLWVYLFNELTQTYGVHNLLWEMNLYCWSDESALWYPGDEYVDIVGYDKYNVKYNRHDGKTSGPNEEAEANYFYNLVKIVKNKKMVSMPENDTVPSLKNMKVENVPWLYFCTWYDTEMEDSNVLSSKNYQNPETLTELYQSDFCITFDDLPDYRNGEIE